MRPSQLIVVTGTATEIGKTWVAAALAGQARDRGMTVAARKPVQSFAPTAGETQVTDADVLAAATGEAPETICRPERSYPLAMAPPMAAAALGLQPPTLADLSREISRSWPSGRIAIGLVEGAGGVASPIAIDGHTADLTRALGADRAILVADPELGVINAVRLALACLAPIPVVVYLNCFQPDSDLHQRNHHWLQHHDGVTITTSIDGLLDAVVG